ncbi:MAG: hypothetical protein ACI9DC_004101 [Gammaproteobacteria bacterium]|jgi:hypothetical protein
MRTPRELLVNRRLRQALLACVVLVCTSGTPLAAGPTAVGHGLALSCSQPVDLSLRCDYRLTANGQPLAATARIGDLPLPNPTFAARTGAPTGLAVLLLIDTSDPARAPVINKARAHISRLLNEAEPHVRFGLASFDSNLKILAPLGSDIDTLVAAANGLSAKGRTTELYRNVVDALKLLATTTDEHKVLMVFSDGLAEDRAYFHADAIQTALEKRIAIYSVGYPRSVALSVGLQSLRRLSDESGGNYVAADGNLDLPEGFFLDSFSQMENVGALSVDLNTAAKELVGGTHELQVMMETNAGPTQATIPINLPARIAAEPVIKIVEIEVPKIIEVEKIVRVPQQAATSVPNTGTARAGTEPQNGIPLWYWVLAIALLALALLVLLLVLLMQRRAGAAQSQWQSAPAAVSLDGLAYLVLEQDRDQIPHSITSATFRIGRLADNDLVIRDPSVSRHHAEIRRRRDGGFQVIDLNSMNGVFVNGTKTRESDLSQDDRLDVGDVRMLFGAENVDELVGEETVMLRTVLPGQPFPKAANSPNR